MKRNKTAHSEESAMDGDMSYSPMPAEITSTDVKEASSQAIRRSVNAAAEIGRPSSVDTGPTAGEGSIIDAFVTLLEALKQFANKELGDRLRRLMATTAQDIGSIQKAAEAMVHNAFACTESLEQKEEKVIRAGGAENRLRVNQKVGDRKATFAEHIGNAAVVILLFWIIDASGSAVIYAGVSPDGFAGGLMLALLTSAAIIVSGALTGFLALRLMWRVSIWEKLLGAVLAIGLTLFGCSFALLLAHYREAAELAMASASAPTGGLLEGVTTGGGNVLVDGFRHMQEMGWLHLTSLESISLLVLSISIFVLTAWKFLTVNDPVIGLAAAVKAREGAEKDRDDEVLGSVEFAKSVPAKAVRDEKSRKAHLEALLSRASALPYDTRNRILAYQSTAEHFWDFRQNKLREWRDLYRAMRDNAWQPPTYWSDVEALDIALARKGWDELAEVIENRVKALPALIKDADARITAMETWAADVAHRFEPMERQLRAEMRRRAELRLARMARPKGGSTDLRTQS